MAAVNSSHLIQIVNNYVRVFNKSTGAAVAGEAMTMNTFFGRTGMIDPRITFDSSNSRWIACAVGRSPDVLRIAVSKTSTATLAATNWDIHEISLPVFGAAIDWPTLAVDANGVYITIAYFNNQTITENKVVAIRKSNLYAGSLVYDVKSVTLGELDALTIFPAHNLNSTPVGQFGGYSWFISRLKSSGTGSSYQPGLLAYRRGCWSTSTTFSWVDANWVVLNPTSMPRYFALQDADVHAPAKSGFSADLRNMGSRYMSAIIQGTNLWACHTIGLDGTDGNYGGTETGSTVDRTGIQWWKYGIETSGANLSSAISGIIFDNAASPTAPYWFYTGSLAVNSAGHVLFGFSGSKSNEEAGAFHYGRLDTGAFPDRVALIQPGGPSATTSGVLRWGDYSATFLDPDGSTFWTAQEYMDGDMDGGDLHWASWINSVKINP